MLPQVVLLALTGVLVLAVPVRQPGKSQDPLRLHPYARFTGVPSGPGTTTDNWNTARPSVRDSGYASLSSLQQPGASTQPAGSSSTAPPGWFYTDTNTPRRMESPGPIDVHSGFSVLESNEPSSLVPGSLSVNKPQIPSTTTPFALLNQPRNEMGMRPFLTMWRTRPEFALDRRRFPEPYVPTVPGLGPHPCKAAREGVQGMASWTGKPMVEQHELTDTFYEQYYLICPATYPKPDELKAKETSTLHCLWPACLLVHALTFDDFKTHFVFEHVDVVIKLRKLTKTTMAPNKRRRVD